jgi:hypothetical protein
MRRVPETTTVSIGDTIMGNAAPSIVFNLLYLIFMAVVIKKTRRRFKED